MLSVGKVITWSSPSKAIGGLLFSFHPSQEVSFLQEINIVDPTDNNILDANSTFFTTNDLVALKFHLPQLV